MHGQYASVRVYVCVCFHFKLTVNIYDSLYNNNGVVNVMLDSILHVIQLISDSNRKTFKVHRYVLFTLKHTCS